MVVAPSFWFRDVVTVVQPGGRTATGYGAGTEASFRCRFMGTHTVHYDDGVETLGGSAYLLAPKLPSVVRTYVRTREVPTAVRAVGDRVPFNRDVRLPRYGGFVLSRADVVEFQETFEALSVHPGDTVRYGDKVYTVLDVREFDGLSGPDHLKIMLKDRR